MTKDVQSFVREYMVCQTMKSSQLSPTGLLAPLPIPDQVFDEVSMYFITGLPPSFGKTVIFVVVDRLSKFAHFFALPSKFDSAKLANVFLNGVVKLHGVPTKIISDRDPLSLSKFWDELTKLQGTTIALSSAYHPETDGQTEAVNKVLEMYLRCTVAAAPNTWVTVIPWAEYWYNTSHHSSAGMTPFRALYGCDPPTLIRYIPGTAKLSTVDHELSRRDRILDQLKTNLLRSQTRMKNQADKHRRDVSFEVGDWLFVKLQPYRQLSLKLYRNQKLGQRYFGPFKVLKKIGPVAYKLDLPPSSRIHPVFHVSVLKKCVGQPQSQNIPLPLIEPTIEQTREPSHILATRTSMVEGLSQPQLLIQWEGMGTEGATWLSTEEFNKSFPNWNLEDKVRFVGESNVTGLDPATKNKRCELVGPLLQRKSQCEKRASVVLKDYVVGDLQSVSN